MKFDEVPFVPCNDCTTYESCTQEAYEQGKKDGRTEAIDKVAEAIDNTFHNRFYCIEDMCDSYKDCTDCLFEGINKILERLKEPKE